MRCSLLCWCWVVCSLPWRCAKHQRPSKPTRLPLQQAQRLPQFQKPPPPPAPANQKAIQVFFPKPEDPPPSDPAVAPQPPATQTPPPITSSPEPSKSTEPPTPAS